MAGLTLEDVKREKEFRKCGKSFPHFFLQYWKVVIPGRVTHAENRPEQLESAQVFQDENRVVVLKARQIGWSTLVAAYCFWKAFFHDAMPCMVVSKREDPEAREILAKIKVGYDNLPLWLRRRGPRPMRWNLGKVEFANGSFVDSDASMNNPARGRTLGLLVIDEFGKLPNPEDAWGAALPATEFGQLIVIGNPNGYGTEFWRLYTQAKKGLNNFRSLFYPWWVVPGRDQEWYKRETSSMTPAQAAAEYCEDDESCWTKSGSPVFDVERVKEFPVEVAARGRLTPLGFRHDEHDGELQVWREPNIHHTYVIGADIADGLEYGDYSTAAVFCANTGEHVAQFKAHIDATHFGRFLAELGKYYGWAMIAPERNRNGGSVISFMREELRYPKVYRERTLSGTNARVRFTDKFGWNTTKESKAVLVNDMWRQLVDGTVVSKSLDLFSEMSTFRYRPDGTMGGSPHDDVLISVGIAIQMLKATSVRSTPEARQPESIDWSKPQFPFGTTFGEMEEWMDQQPGKSTQSGRTMPQAVQFRAATNGRAKWQEESPSDDPSPRSSGLRPSSVALNSRRTRTRGGTTSTSQRDWLSD